MARIPIRRAQGQGVPVPQQTQPASEGFRAFGNALMDVGLDRMERRFEADVRLNIAEAQRDLIREQSNAFREAQRDFDEAIENGDTADWQSMITSRLNEIHDRISGRFDGVRADFRSQALESLGSISLRAGEQAARWAFQRDNELTVVRAGEQQDALLDTLRNDPSLETFDEINAQAEELEQELAAGSYVSPTEAQARADRFRAQAIGAIEDSWVARTRDNPEGALTDLSGETRERLTDLLGPSRVSALHTQAVDSAAKVHRGQFFQAMSQADAINASEGVPGAGIAALKSRIGTRAQAFRNLLGGLQRISGITELSESEKARLNLAAGEARNQLLARQQADLDTMRAVEMAALAASSPDFNLTPNTDVERDGANLYFNDVIVPTAAQNLQAGASVEDVSELVADQVATMGHVPGALNQWVEQLTASNDPQQLSLAARTLDRIRDQSPRAGAQLPKETQQKLSLYPILEASRSPEEAVQLIAQLQSGSFANNDHNRVFEERFADHEDLAGENIAETMMGNMNRFFRDDPNNIPPAARRQYKTLVQLNYATMTFDDGDVTDAERFELAKKQAAKDLQASWGITRLGGDGTNRWVIDAPETVYGLSGKSLGENAQWMEQDLRNTVNEAAAKPELYEGKRLAIELSPTTDDDGRKVYFVRAVDEDAGTTSVILDKNGQPIEWYPDWDTSATLQATEAKAAYLSSGSPEDLEAAVEAIKASGGLGIFGGGKSASGIRQALMDARDKRKVREQRAREQRLAEEAPVNAPNITDFITDPFNMEGR